MFLIEITKILVKDYSSRIADLEKRIEETKLLLNHLIKDKHSN